MNRFHSGTGNGKFSAMLRGLKHQGGTPGATKNPGGVAPKGTSTRIPKPDAHMDARDKEPKGKGQRVFKGKPWPNRKGVRIAEGNPGSAGRKIHFPNIKESAGSVPAHQSVINRSSSRRTTKGKNLGSSGMSKTIAGRPGVPAHQSVINRSSKHTRSRNMNLASKLNF